MPAYLWPYLAASQGCMSMLQCATCRAAQISMPLSVSGRNQCAGSSIGCQWNGQPHGVAASVSPFSVALRRWEARAMAFRWPALVNIESGTSFFISEPVALSSS